jgi:hypothetical protein
LYIENIQFIQQITKGEHEMKKVQGTLLEKEGKFFVQMGREMQELNPNPYGGAETLKANVGQTVQVILTDPQIVAILTKKVPVACFAPCFICYKPIEFIGNWFINPAIRTMNLKAFLEEGLISKEVYEQQMKVR